MLSSFRRDYARTTQEVDIHEFVDELRQGSPDFKQWWSRHDVHVPCDGARILRVDSHVQAFDHTSLTVNADRHLRMVVYARQQRNGHGAPGSSTRTAVPSG